MLCGVCWRAPWPTQPAATGHMALWRLAYPLAAWHCGLLAGGRPFPVAGVVSLSQCGGVGIRGGHLPGVQAGPIRQYILGSGHLLRSERGELRSFPPASGSWQSWRSPGGLSGTSSGRTLGGRQEWVETVPVRSQYRTLPPSVRPYCPGFEAAPPRPPPPRYIFMRQLCEVLQGLEKKRLSLQKTEEVFWEGLLLLGLGK